MTQASEDPQVHQEAVGTMEMGAADTQTVEEVATLRGEMTIGHQEIITAGAEETQEGTAVAEVIAEGDENTQLNNY